MNLKLKILTAILLFFSLTALSLAQVAVETTKITNEKSGAVLIAEKIKEVGEVVGNTEKIVKSAPFSAEAMTESIQTLSDGNRIVHQTKTKMYRDKEGRFRREEFVQPNGKIGSMIEVPPTILITDPVAGIRYFLNTASKSFRREAIKPGKVDIEVPKNIPPKKEKPKKIDFTENKIAEKVEKQIANDIKNEMKQKVLDDTRTETQRIREEQRKASENFAGTGISKAEYEKIKEEIRNIKKEFENLKNSNKKMESRAADLQEAVKRVEDAVERGKNGITKEELKKIEEVLQEAESEIEGIKSEVETNNQEIQESEQEMRKTVKRVESLTVNGKTVKKEEFERIKEEIKNNKKDIQDAKDEIEKNNKEIEKRTKEIRQTVKKIEETTINGKTVKVEESSKSFYQENVVTESLGTKNIEGVEAEGTRSTKTIQAGEIGNERPITIVYEKWYSKDLQLVVMSKHSDPRFGENSYRLTNIKRSEPDLSLFTPPGDYRIVNPKKGPGFEPKLPKSEINPPRVSNPRKDSNEPRTPKTPSVEKKPSP